MHGGFKKFILLKKRKGSASVQIRRTCEDSTEMYLTVKKEFVTKT